jgi:uncharacterized protein (DUF2252 family)
MILGSSNATGIVGSPDQGEEVSERGRGYPTVPRSPHLTVDERIARGKAARAQIPRSANAFFEPPEDRPDPIALLEQQAATRVPDLVPIRYGRMLISPFTFYRGAASIMAADLASTPTTGLRVQLCGDAHLCNFGVFGSPERNLVFDVNDFDETLPGPWEWDVMRLAASLEVAGRNNRFSKSERRDVVLAGVREYRTSMARFAHLSNLELWYLHLDVTSLLPRLEARFDRKRVKALEKDVTKARTRDHVRALAKLTVRQGNEPRIASDPPLVVAIDELLPEGRSREEVIELLLRIIHGYPRTLESHRRHLLEQYRFVHAARKVVGIGSVGTRTWIALLLGKDDQDPLFLQMKEAGASVLERLIGKSAYSNHGQRVVVGQRLMQATSDIFLGWLRITEPDGVQRDYYVRQLRDMKGSVEVETLPPDAMSVYARLCAGTLARAHARSGDRVAIAAYMGKGAVFDRAVADFSVAYADQTERDHDRLAQAVKKGQIEAVTGL